MTVRRAPQASPAGRAATAGVVTDEEAWRRASNPVLPGFHPDPSVCRVDGADGTWFYLVTSTFEHLPGLPVHRSRDLLHWEPVGHAITDQLHFEDVHDSGGLYAPTLRHDGERFLLVCTHLGAGAGRSGTFLLTATDAAGPWAGPVWWPDAEGVDPSLLVDDDGRLWAHGARGARSPRWPDEGEVWVREVDPETLALVGPEHVVWHGALLGATWTEGPHLYRRGPWVHLVAAEGGTGRHHAVTTARAPSPAGPFEGSPDNPALTHRMLGPGAAVVNVGHADLVEAPDGSWWALVLASRLVDGVDLLGRETFLAPVAWHDERPVLAPGVGTLVPEPGGPRGAVRAADPPTGWLAVRRLPADVADLPADPTAPLVLHAGGGLGSRLPAFVGRRLRHVDATVRLDLGAAARAWASSSGGEVGLALRQSTTQWLTVGLRELDGRPTLVVSRCVDGTTDVVARTPVTSPGAVEVHVRGRRATVGWRTGTDRTTVVEVDVAHLSTTHAGWFVGVVAGAFAVGPGDVEAGPLSVGPTPVAGGAGGPASRTSGDGPGPQSVAGG